MVGPPRFELRAAPGAVLRESIDVGSDAFESADFVVRSADWKLSADGSPTFDEGALVPGSCRPWVRLERREFKLAPKGRRKFRFEIHVPADASEGECRFALLVEGKEITASGGARILMPMQGRVAVIVYVSVAGARPALSFRSIQVDTINGKPYPTITFQNSGSAHGRPEGTLEARDADGKSLEFTVSPSPILPGETRAVPIWPNDGADGKSPAFRYPLRLKGTVEWAGGRHEVETVVRP